MGSHVFSKPSRKPLLKELGLAFTGPRLQEKQRSRCCRKLKAVVEVGQSSAVRAMRSKRDAEIRYMQRRIVGHYVRMPRFGRKATKPSLRKATVKVMHNCLCTDARSRRGFGGNALCWIEYLNLLELSIASKGLFSRLQSLLQSAFMRHAQVLLDRQGPTFVISAANRL